MGSFIRTGRPVINVPRRPTRRPADPPSPVRRSTLGEAAVQLVTGAPLIQYRKSGTGGPAPCVDLIVSDPSVSNEDQAEAWPDYVCVPSVGYGSPTALDLSPTFYVTESPDDADVTYEVNLGSDDGASLFMQRPSTETASGHGTWALSTADVDAGTYAFRSYSDGPVLVGLSVPTPHLMPISHRLCANGGRVTAVVEEGSEVGVSFRWKAPSGRSGDIRYWFVDADYEPINATYQPSGFSDTIGLPYYRTATSNFLGSGGSWATFDVSTVRGYLPAPAGAVGVIVGIGVNHPGVSSNAGAFVYLDEITIEIL